MSTMVPCSSGGVRGPVGDLLDELRARLAITLAQPAAIDAQGVEETSRIVGVARE